MLSWMIQKLPVSTGYPQAAHDAVSGIGSYFGLFDSILPMDTLGTVVGLIFAVEIAIFSWNVLRWSLSHIPIIGAKFR